MSATSVFFTKWSFVYKYFWYCRGGQSVSDQEPHFLLCYSKESHHSLHVGTPERNG